MSESSSSNPEPPAQTVLQDLDALCRSFEAEWASGSRPRIETYLEGAEASERRGLLRRLVGREYALRLARGERPSWPEYTTRFPGFAADVERALAEATSLPTRTVALAPGALRMPTDSDLGFEVGPTPPRDAFGPYRVLGEIGRGGMGIVYRARHERTHDEVAIKTVRVRRQSLLHRIRREIHSLARIRHPGLVRIVETGLVDGQPWYAMELLEGATLHDYFREARSRALRTWGPGELDPIVPDSLTAAEGARQDAPLDATRPFHEGRPAPPPSAMEVCLDAGDWTDRVEEGGGWAMGDDQRRDFLTLMGRLCAVLAYLHGEGIVHRDLKPQNIMVRPDLTPVVLDFGLASSFGAGGREVLEVGRGAEGTPSYMAPEQIRGEPVDARADLYSVGCILYEGVTGRVPFRRPTARGVLWAHVAEEPTPPGRLVPDLPGSLDELILRLLAKRPGDRLGHARDVVAALARLGAEVGDWAAGRPPRDCLYRPGFVGRDAVLEDLARRIRRAVDGHGPGRCLFLRGYSGVGKTRLIIELARRLERASLTVLTGECLPIDVGRLGDGDGEGDGGGPAVRSTPLHPFRAFLQAVADTCVELGPAGARRLLGDRGPILAACEPALASIPGGDGPMAPPCPTRDEARSRLLDALAETLDQFSRPGPVALLLDDLQWADELTLDFLDLFHRGTWEIPGLAIVAAYRSDEEAAVFQGRGGGFEGIDAVELGPLEKDSLRAIVAGMLGSDRLDEGLVDHLAGTSQGNPFYVAEFLAAALAEGLLARGDDGRWQVRRAAGDGATGSDPFGLPGSLRELIVRRFARLAAPDRALLKLLAVIGREIDVGLLESVGLLEDAELMGGLDRLLSAGIVEASGEGPYRFVHDKLREVAYAEIPPGRRRELHRRVALAVEARSGSGEDLARQYPILAHHWHRSIGDRRAEPDRVAKALDYLEKSLAQATNAGASREAVDFGLAAARLLDVELPEQPEEIGRAIDREMARVRDLMAGRRPPALLDLPPSRDPRIDRVIRLLQAIHPPAHISNQLALTALAATKNLSLTLEHGPGPWAPSVYAMFAIVARNLLEDSRLADEFIRLAAAEDERQGRPLAATVAMVRGWFINHWVAPFREALEPCLAGGAAGFAAGDELFGCFCCATYVAVLAQSGAPLDDVARAADEQITRIARRVFVSHYHCVLERQLAHALAGRTRSPSSLSDDAYDEARDLASVCRTANSNQVGYYHTYRLRLLYHLGEYDEAVAAAERAWAVLPAFKGQSAEMDLAFFHALALLARWSAEAPLRDQDLARARSHRDLLARWSADCEANFRHKLAMVEAELARVEGRDDEAVRLYDLAVRSADAFGYVQHAALAHELAAAHHARLGNVEAADADAAEAVERYRRWGAVRLIEKVERLRKTFR